LKIKIAWIGKTKDPAIDSLSAEYLKRLSRDAEGLAVKDEAALLRLAQNKHRLVLMESAGRQLTSEEFAGFIREHLEKNAMPLVFAIGAASGFRGELRKAASTVISLGKITMPHELARVVLIEQVYRAFTILNRHPYHLGH
jgi:23S rRNA (pseudouridine1915-N3)-methyltransferase